VNAAQKAYFADKNTRAPYAHTIPTACCQAGAPPNMENLKKNYKPIVNHAPTAE